MKVFLSLGMSGKSENEIRKNIDSMKLMSHYIFNNLKRVLLKLFLIGFT